MSRRARPRGRRKPSVSAAEAAAHARRYDIYEESPAPDPFGEMLRRALADALRSVLADARVEFADFEPFEEIPRPRRPAPPWADPNFVPPPRARAGRSRPRPAPPPPVVPDPFAVAVAVLELGGKKLTRKLVRDQRKKLAQEHHPDRPGGNVERMKQINAAADFLLEQLPA